MLSQCFLQMYVWHVQDEAQRLLEKLQHHYILIANEVWLLCVQTHLMTAKYSVILFGVKPILLILEETQLPWSESTAQGQQRGTFTLPMPPTRFSSSRKHVYDGIHSGFDFSLWRSLSATSYKHLHLAHIYTQSEYGHGAKFTY